MFSPIFTQFEDRRVIEYLLLRKLRNEQRFRQSVYHTSYKPATKKGDTEAFFRMPIQDKGTGRYFSQPTLKSTLYFWENTTDPIFK